MTAIVQGRTGRTLALAVTRRVMNCVLASKLQVTTVAPKNHGKMSIGGSEYSWNIRYRAQAGPGRLRGASLYVFIPAGEGRDLILDFPYGELGSFDRTADHSAVMEALKTCVPLALRAGWDPTKRGKPIRFDASALRREV
jgi:hypothetical protein